MQKALDDVSQVSVGTRNEQTFGFQGRALLRKSKVSQNQALRESSMGMSIETKALPRFARTI